MRACARAWSRASTCVQLRRWARGLGRLCAFVGRCGRGRVRACVRACVRPFVRACVRVCAATRARPGRRQGECGGENPVARRRCRRDPRRAQDMCSARRQPRRGGATAAHVQKNGGRASRSTKRLRPWCRRGCREEKEAESC
eukprot:5439955-Pleurochrysis_carterae.AAC.2